MPKITTLELEIKQTITNSRSTALEKLAERLNTLKTALTSMGNLNAEVTALKNLADTVSELGSTTRDASSFSSSINRMSKAIETMSQAAGKVDSLSAAFRGVAEASANIDENAFDRMSFATDTMQASALNVSRFSKALDSVGSSSQGVYSSMGRLTALFEGIGHASAAIDTTKLEQLDSASMSLKHSGSGIASFGRAIDSVGTSMEEMQVKAGRLEMFFYGLQDAAGAIDPARLAPIVQIAQTIGTAASGLNRFTGALGKLSEFAQSSDKVTQVFQLIDNLIGRLASRQAELAQLAESLTAITAGLRAMNRAGDIGQKMDAAQKSTHGFRLSLDAAVKSGGKLLGAGWDKLKSKISGLLGPISNLLHSFGRIAMYRGLRTAIKAITQGFSQGIEHLYKWSALVGNSFKQSMDSIATSAHYLRDSLGAMASPLLDALAPAIEILVDKFVSLLNVANQFFAALTGKTTWRKAVRTPTEWAKATDDATDSTKKATEAQKKLNKALMDFDEIHLLTTSTTKGSNPKDPSSGGNGSGIDSTHFEEVPIASWIQDIKDAIANGDWYGAGKLLADKLNGIIDDWDAEAWGRKLGEKIQHGIEFYLGFMQNFHWDTVGEKIADFLNGMIDEINPDDLGEAIVAKFNAAIDLLSGFTNRFNWEAAGKWLADVLVGAFTGLKWKTLGELIGNLAGGILSFLKAGLDELLNRKGEVMDAIGDFFSGLGWGGLKNVVELSAIVLGFKALFGAVFGDSGLINYVKEKASGFVSSIGTNIKYYLSGLGATMGTTSLGAVTIIGSVVMGACTLKDWIESCREKGLLKGTLSTFGGEDGAWYHAILGGGESIGTVGQATIKLFLDLDDQGGVAAFKDKLDAVLEKVKAILRALGFNLPEDNNLPTSNTPVVSQSTPGAQFDPTTGEYFVSSQTGKIREDIDYINSHPANINVTDVGGGLATGAANAGALVSKAGLGGLKGDYPTKVSAADLGAAKGNAVALVGKAGLGGLAKTYSSKVSITNLSSAGTQVDKLMQLGKLKKSYTTELNFKTSVVTAKGGSSSGTTSSLLTKSQLVKVLNAYAMGGFPSDDLTQGSLFVAGEMPGQAEMVGNINGKTGVASGKEITGIGDAVRETGANEAALLREQNQLLRQILAKSGSVTLAPSAAAGRWVSQSQAAYARATGV